MRRHLRRELGSQNNHGKEVSMQPIECGQCGTTVLAEKYSAQHTSVQWLDEADRVCPQLRNPNGDGLQGTTDRICPQIHATIDQAVRDGILQVTVRTEPTPGELG